MLCSTPRTRLAAKALTLHTSTQHGPTSSRARELPARLRLQRHARDRAFSFLQLLRPCFARTASLLDLAGRHSLPSILRNKVLLISNGTGGFQPRSVAERALHND